MAKDLINSEKIKALFPDREKALKIICKFFNNYTILAVDYTPETSDVKAAIGDHGGREKELIFLPSFTFSFGGLGKEAVTDDLTLNLEL